MNVEKATGSYNVLDSGTFLTYDSNAGASFTIKMDETFSFILNLEFESSEPNESFLKQKVSENTITFTCENFDNSLGIGTKTPIELATFRGKKVYINFWVYMLGEKAVRKIVYTFYYKSQVTIVDGKINQSLNDTSSTLTTIIQSDNFVNLAPQTQTSIIEAVHDDKGKGAGFVGKFLGVNTQNAAIHFAFIICLLLFALILITMIYAWVTNGTMNVELIGTFLSPISLSLGYIFGKGTSN